MKRTFRWGARLRGVWSKERYEACQEGRRMDDNESEITASEAPVEAPQLGLMSAMASRSAFLRPINDLLRSPTFTRLTSRLLVWGLGSAIASPMVSAIFGTSLFLGFAGAVGTVLAGLGAIGMSLVALLRRDVRPTWKLGAALGVPFGMSLLGFGMWSILGTFSWTLPAPIAFAGSLILVLGLVLSTLLGVDILRFVGTALRSGNPEDSAS